MKIEIVNGKKVRVETELDRFKKFINDPRSRSEKLRDENYDWERHCDLYEEELPKPTDRYDRNFEIERNEFSMFGSSGQDFSYGKRTVWDERRLAARVAELKAQGCKLSPGESLNEFVERNIEEVN